MLCDALLLAGSDGWHTALSKRHGGQKVIQTTGLDRQRFLMLPGSKTENTHSPDPYCTLILLMEVKWTEIKASFRHLSKVCFRYRTNKSLCLAREFVKNPPPPKKIEVCVVTLTCWCSQRFSITIVSFKRTKTSRGWAEIHSEKQHPLLTLFPHPRIW